jgi:hypothetical protein
MFERTRKVGNNFYRYREERKRVGGKVKSISTYLGRVDDTTRGLRFIESQIEQYPRQNKDDPPNDLGKEKGPEDGADAEPAES